jgi:hypothetical protein
MATKRPSFLKRQKELKRIARAQEKRDVRRGRKETDPPQPFDFASPDPSAEASGQE